MGCYIRVVRRAALRMVEPVGVSGFAAQSAWASVDL